MNYKFIITSPSASGKTTLVNKLLETFPELYRLKTCTSRPIRPEETGDEYYFLSKESASRMIAHNEFVEYATVYGNTYGLLKSEIDSNIHKNIVVILDVQGAKKAKKLYPDSKTIFIEPPSRDELYRRLNNRNTSNEDVTTRLNEFDNEMNEMKTFDHVIKYSSLDDMSRQLNRYIEFFINNEK